MILLCCSPGLFTRNDDNNNNSKEKESGVTLGRLPKPPFSPVHPLVQLRFLPCMIGPLDYGVTYQVPASSGHPEF